MRDLKRYFLGSVVCIVFSALLYGQDPVVKQICGSDTVKISLDNYLFGKVDWQESYDGENWLSIEGEHDTVYICLTSEEKYIRGCITTSDCEQVFSDIAFIRQKPVAYAGMDKDVMMYTIALQGNAVDGSSGKWEIIQGEGALLSSPESASTLLTMGESAFSDTAYFVSWTLQNEVCGSSTDTIKITPVINDYCPYRVLFGPGDSIIEQYSDIEQGIYYIQFDTVQTVVDSSILIGYIGDGFLRKVQSFDSINELTYKFYTTPAELEDLLIEGVLNVGDDIMGDSTMNISKSGSSPYILDHLPSSKEILSDPKYKNGNFVYYFPDEHDPASLLKSKGTRKGGVDLFEFDSVTVKVDFTDELSMEVGLDGGINFDPNFVFDYRIKCGFPHKWWKYECNLNYLKAGMENAVLSNNFTVFMKSEFSWSDSLVNKSKKAELFKMKSRKVVIAGTVPILVVNNISLDFSIVPKLEAEINASYTWKRSSTFSAYLLYERGNFLKPVCSKGPSSNSTNYTINFIGTAGVDFVLEPKIDMMIYGIIGPYLKVPISLKPEICYSYWNYSGDDKDTWGFNVPLSIDAELGCEMKLFRKVLFNASVGTNIYNTGFYHPYRIDMVSGNNQLAHLNEKIVNPFQVQVKNNWGGGSKKIPVYFSVIEGDGILDYKKVTTGEGGWAENFLTLGDSSYYKIKVEVLACDSSLIEGSEDLFFEVNSGCKNSSLQLSFEYLEDKTVQVYGVMGTEPYMYSLDDLNYEQSLEPMNIEDAIVQKYFYVKDAEGCKASSSVEAIDSCRYSELAVSVKLSAANAIAEGISGTPPYKYALDSELDYTASGEFNYLDLGKHEVFIKDKSGCTASQVFNIHIESTNSLLAFYPFSGNANDESGNFHDGIVKGGILSPDRFENPENAYFLGWGDGIDIPADDSLIFEDDFSINLWTYTSFSSEIVSDDHALLSIGKEGQDSNGLHFLLRDSDGAPYYKLYTNDIGSGITMRDEGASMDAWHMYTIVRAADTISLYRDEEQIGSFYQPGVLGESCIFHLGNTFDGSMPLNTRIDDIRIYKRAIMGSEIKKFFNEYSMKDGLLGDTFTDPWNGAVYKQVRIGSQVWMAENLRATTYSDGSAILCLTGYEWSGTTDGAYCWYDNDSINYASTYGALYNSYSIESGNFCPAGWHVPSDDEWSGLGNYVGGQDVAGGKLKEAGFSHWLEPNTGATDEKGFKALPGGFRDGGGTFIAKEFSTFWWSTTTNDSNQRIYYRATNSTSHLYRQSGVSKNYGYSVRCIRDE